MDKSNIGALFDRIAGSYDGLNHFLSLGIDRGWRKKAARGMAAGGDVLDVAIGTADLAIEILRQGKAQKVTGLDLSKNMMEIGRKKVLERKLGDKVRFIEGSALEMPFPDCSFDAVTCAFGVRNFSELDRGLGEMFRVMKDGGELTVLEFSYPENRFIRFFYDLYFSHVLPLAGRIASRDKTAYRYLNRSVKGFIWGEELCSHLRAAGFTDTAFRPLTFGIAMIYKARRP